MTFHPFRGALLLFAAAPLFAQITVNVAPNLAPPQPVGTPIVFTAMAGGGSGNYDYQFTVGRPGARTLIRQDFVSNNAFAWNPSQKEGEYTIGVTARDLANKTLRASTAYVFAVAPALVGGQQAVHPTVHPLVALFSAPPCPVGQKMRVLFFLAKAGSGKFSTNGQACDNATSMNFYIAGMYPNSPYTMKWQTIDTQGRVVSAGQPLPFTTGAIPANVALPSPIFVPSSSPGLTPPETSFPILLHSFTPGFGTNFVIAATDAAGKYLWYSPMEISNAPRTEVGGLFFANQNGDTSATVPDPYAEQIQEMDLVGDLVWNTNAEIVSEQLVAMGKPPVTGFSHELRRLPAGDLLTIGSEERLVANANQCGTTGGVPNTCDVLGDEVIVLDKNLQVKWAWDAFDQGAYTSSSGTHQLVDQPAVLGEACAQGGNGCPPFYLAPTAKDWMHSNTASLAADGNIVLAVRHLDWVIKLNYANGAGDGRILWRMGPNGDFTLTTINTQGTDDLATFPWFSHPHDAEFALNDQPVGGVQIFAAYDNGNTRRAQVNPHAHSRGQIYAVNEPALTANLNINVDLGVYSLALGTAQLLPDGNLWFQSGAVGAAQGAPPYIQETEADQSANLLFILQVGLPTASQHALEYRCFRMQSLYAGTP